ncbi:MULTISPECIES: fibronectin type III domain-containing protein [unclassified Nonomuraea]|uniref:fibronectin type III domain-containing protein n=1 Tax=unclassified Nonomuraea TaxID=2593643 RepID=UPI0033F9E3D0
MEYSVNGGPGTEPLNSRFLRIRRSGDASDQSGAHSYTLPGYAWMLDKLILYAGPVMNEGKRPFSAISPSAILRTFVGEGQARSALPGLAVDFTASADSAGQPWDATLTLELEPGTRLLAILINLAEQGIVDWAMQGRTLRVWNEGTALAEDLASGPAPVDLRLGRDVVEAPDEGTLEELASAILIEGEDGFSLEVTNPSALTPWGRWEAHQQQGGVSDSGTAQLLGQAALERTSRERVQITRGITLYEARWLPWADYAPGSHVLAPGDGAVMQSLRVRQITLAKDQSGELAGNVVLNDRFLEADLKLARRMAGILGGGVATGGSGGEPAPETGGRVPAAPAGLIVSPLAYVDEHGFARGQITATWSPVSQDVNGVSLDIDGYELFARVNSVGEVWRMIARTQASDTTATYSPLSVGVTYAFKVRATAQGVPGEFSAQFVSLIPENVTPPPVPTDPALSTRLGVIEVAWDGLGAGAVPMPSDFDRVKVWMATAAAGPWTLVDHLRAAGAALIADQPYNATRWFRFTSVDRRGDESAPSGTASIATQPLVNTDIIGEIINGANIVDGSITASDKVVANTITGGLIQANAIATGHLQANAVEADKIAAGAVTAVKLSADAIDGKTITGVFIRTAATGRRLEFAPPGATYPEMRFIPAAAGSNYTRLRTRDDQFPSEATFEITSGTNSGATAASQTTIAAGFMQMQVRDAGLANPNGGLMELAESYARYGYFKDASTEQYFWFDNSGRTRHVGKWWDFTVLGSTAGILAGSLVFPSTGAAPNTRVVSYGATMSGNMGPVCVIRRGLSSPSTHNPSGSWYVTESLQTSFRINTSFVDGYAAYWWSHRH